MDATYKRKRVLTDDEYTEALEKIIQREFFPDLERLKEVDAFIDAVERGDVGAMHRIKEQYGGRTPALTASPAPGLGGQTPVVGGVGSTALVIGGARIRGSETGTSLDSFLAKNTSEEDVSFEMLLDNDRRDHRRKHEWAFHGDRYLIEGVPSSGSKMIADGSSATGVLLIEAKSREAAHDKLGQLRLPPTAAQRSGGGGAMAPPPKVIDTRATRFRGPDAPAAAIGGGRAPKRAKTGPGIGPPQPAGSYPIVQTPKVAPGQDDDAFVTWGEVGGTPLVLAVDKDELITDPHEQSFSLPKVRKREETANALSEKAAKAVRAKRQGSRTPTAATPIHQKLLQAAGLTPRGGGGGASSSGLARLALAMTPSKTDIFAHSAAYKPAARAAVPTPVRSTATPTPTPQRRTRRAKDAVAAAGSVPVQLPASGGLTDDLLDF